MMDKDNLDPKKCIQHDSEVSGSKQVGEPHANEWSLFSWLASFCYLAIKRLPVANIKYISTSWQPWNNIQPSQGCARVGLWQDDNWNLFWDCFGNKIP